MSNLTIKIRNDEGQFRRLNEIESRDKTKEGKPPTLPIYKYLQCDAESNGSEKEIFVKY